METTYSSGFAEAVAGSAGDAVCCARLAVDPAFLSQCSRLTASVSPVRAEEHLIVALSAISQAVWDHGLKGEHFDCLREALAEQMVQLADAVRAADGAQDTQFGELDETERTPSYDPDEDDSNLTRGCVTGCES